MKHNIKITTILLLMFIITQFIGLYVVNFYSPTKIVEGVQQNITPKTLPYGMQTPEVEQEKDFYYLFPSIIFAFVIAITLLFLLTKFKAEFFLKTWFFVVIVLSLGISVNSFIPETIKNSSIIALIIVLPFAIVKVFKRNFLIHNLTELFIYPGIAAVFVSVLNIPTIILLLILISVYDIWAVWHSGIMQKMAKYQMDKLKVFGGFFVPNLTKDMKNKIKKLKENKSNIKDKKFKVNVAILGGGDVVFPIIASGVVLKYYGFTKIFGYMIPIHSLFVILGATLGLTYLFFWAEKKKFYPAMPFISAGIFLGMIISWIFF